MSSVKPSGTLNYLRSDSRTSTSPFATYQLAIEPERKLLPEVFRNTRSKVIYQEEYNFEQKDQMTHYGLTLPLSEEKVKKYSQKAREYAILNGLLMVSQDPTSFIEPCPMTLFPTPIPASTFHQLCAIQPVYTELYHKVAHDFNFLEKHLKPIAAVDDYIGRLWRIHEEVKHQPMNEHRCLMLGRNDFMLDQNQPKQIEFNTISAAGGCQNVISREVHTMLLKAMGCGDISHTFPKSQLDSGFAEAMDQCVKMYDSPGSVIMFVVKEGDKNYYDQLQLQRWISRQNPDLKVVRKTITEIDATGRLENGRLIVDGDKVALVYYRTSYSPDNDHGELGWRVRLMMERSRAVLCPCIHTHLAGCKKIQQVLCGPGIVEKYITDAKAAEKIRRTFAQQYPTDQTAEGDFAVELVRNNPDRYILKPQREGGGNKFFGHAIVEELDRLGGSSERGKYILMERVFPPERENYIVSHDQVVFAKTISEISTFVSSIWRNGSSESRVCGDYLRTKTSDQNEGGVCCGRGARDNIVLI